MEACIATYFNTQDLEYEATLHYVNQRKVIQKSTPDICYKEYPATEHIILLYMYRKHFIQAFRKPTIIILNIENS